MIATLNVCSDPYFNAISFLNGVKKDFTPFKKEIVCSDPYFTAFKKEIVCSNPT